MNDVGIDIGGTNIKACLIDSSGAIRRRLRTPTICDDLDALVESIALLVGEFQSTEAVRSVGIGIPGLLSSHTRIIETSPHIPCMHRVNFEAMVSKRLQLPVLSENDANAGAYGEWKMGAGRGLDHMAYVTLGTGLGSGLILNGALFRGATGFAGEMGHMNIEPNGRQCACGATGCLETRVSAPGLVATAREHGLETDSAEAVFDAANRGESAALAAFEDTGRFLGIACASIINLLNLEMIVVSGGVMAAGELLLRSAIAEMYRRAFEPSARVCPIVQSELWPDAGMLGAALLARDRQ